MVEPDDMAAKDDAAQDARIGNAERDLIALGIATASIIMFVGTGGTVLPQVIRAISGYGFGPDKVLVNALLLNIALIIFGWRRYRQLSIEVHHRRSAERKARLLAETDPLTGLLNRRGFDCAAHRCLQHAIETGQSVAVMLIDLDNFKQINDFNGHSAGDQVLLECSRRISATLPKDTLLARIGGDEFACAMTFESTRPDLMDKLANALIEAISEPIAQNGVRLESSASLGITRSDIGDATAADPASPSALLEMADVAMYHAKRQGRNCYFWFEDAMADEMRYRSEIEAGIREGIPKGEFIPYFEQQIDVQTGQLTGFEMLARWDSPKFGIVGPEIFIPIAEEIGVIAELSQSVISQALSHARSWHPSLTLAVNISPLQLRDPWFSQKLLKMLVEANFPPERFEVEITESCLHENISQVRTLITSLKNQGVHISLDDFGTGYSSLAQLRSLPFDRIKIDRSFVTTMPSDSDNAAIVEAIAALGSGLGLPVTAEGVETDEVLSHLRRYGKIKGQGYFYGRPMPAEMTHDCLAELNLLVPSGDDAELRARSVAEPTELPIPGRFTGTG